MVFHVGKLNGKFDDDGGDDVEEEEVVEVEEGKTNNESSNVEWWLRSALLSIVDINNYQFSFLFFF